MYAKGTALSLAGEKLSLRLSIQDGLPGLSLVDSWGTGKGIEAKRRSRSICSVWRRIAGI